MPVLSRLWLTTAGFGSRTTYMRITAAAHSFQFATVDRAADADRKYNPGQKEVCLLEVVWYFQSP